MEFMIDDDKKGLFSDIGLLIMRVSAGLMMAFAHGWPKIQAFGERAEGWDGMFFGLPGALAVGLVILAEFVCALLITVGLMTRLAAIPLIINMSVAAYAHFVMWGDGFGDTELALVFLTIFVMFLFTGPGKISLDEVINRRMKAM